MTAFGNDLHRVWVEPGHARTMSAAMAAAARLGTKVMDEADKYDDAAANGKLRAELDSMLADRTDLEWAKVVTPERLKAHIDACRFALEQRYQGENAPVRSRPNAPAPLP